MTTATTTNQLTIGTILVSRWGYEQTTVDFYEVVRATEKTVTLRQVRARLEHSAALMTYTAEPVPGDYVGEPFRRKIIRTRELYVSINRYTIAKQWNGRPAAGSSYG